MSAPSTENFHEGIIKELTLFDLPPTEVSVSDAYYEEIRPLSQVSGEAPIEFRVSGQNSMDYIDLKSTQVCVKLRVRKADGSDRKNGPRQLISAGTVFDHRNHFTEQGHNYM